MNRVRLGQWTLIGSLISVAILIILAAVFIPKMLKPATRSDEASSALQSARGVACTAYVSQFNIAADEYKQAHGGQAPTTLNDLKTYGVTDEMINSPGCSWQIDPQTGHVSDVGQGRAPVAGQAPAGQPAPSAAPGGVKIPDMSGNHGVDLGN